jgi:EmrB/QacA subfamily drug resistance transporter
MSVGTPDAPALSLSPPEVRVVIWGALLAMALSALDQTIVATAMPAIARDLGDVSLLSWIVSAYLLTSTCITPIVGKLSDLYGRRRMLIGALLVFMLGSALCALSHGMVPLILSRGLQGVGGGSLITLGQAVIGDVVSPRERARYSAYFSIVFASASILGPSLGGFMTQYWGWPWIFWINVPLGLTALVVANRALRKLPVRHRRAVIDYAGIATLSCATVLLLIVVSLGGNRLPWTAPLTLALAAVSAILAAIFFWIQRRAPEPVLPPRILADRVMKPLLAATFVIIGTFLAINVLSPVYFQVALGLPASEAGLLTIPLLVSTTISSSFASRYSSRVGRYKRPTLLSLPVAIAALGVLAFTADRISAPIAAVILTIAGLGIGPAYPASSVAALNAVEPRDMGVASGSLIFARALGSAIMIAVATALVLALAAEALPNGGRGGLEELVRATLTPGARAIVAHSFGIMFGAAAVMLAVGLGIFACVEDRLLRDKPGAANPAPAIE